MSGSCGCLPLAPCPPPMLSIEEFWTFASELKLNNNEVEAISNRCYGSMKPSYDVVVDRGGGVVCGRTCFIAVLTVVSLVVFIIIAVTVLRMFIKRYVSYSLTRYIQQ